jgi:hypothetical protein
MPASTWNTRDERQYRAIVKNCRSGLKTCKRIAAATVNKRRSRGLSGLGSSEKDHEFRMGAELRKIQFSPAPSDCFSSIRQALLLKSARCEAQSAGTDNDGTFVRMMLDSWAQDTAEALNTHCPESKKGPALKASDLNGLEKAEYMLTRGFKDGKKSWIDVMPTHGPKMRVTHEILEGLGDSEQRGPQYAAWNKLKELEAKRDRDRWVAERTCVAWRYDAHGKRFCAIRGSDALKGLDGVGSSLALMWTAAGAVALIMLSDAQKNAAAPSMSVQDPAARVILDDLNRARAAQGLRPIVR